MVEHDLLWSGQSALAEMAFSATVASVNNTLRSAMKQALIYLRVSTGTQLQAVGIPAQRTRIEEYCKANGYEIAGEYVDGGLSGKKMSNRPNLLRCLDRACKEKLTVFRIQSAGPVGQCEIC
jgi:hypothetical protein